MTILNILQYPDPRLKRVGIKVTAVDNRIKKIIDDMFETHYAQENCAALAATQLDIKDAPAITVIDFSPEKNQPLCLINPEIIEKSGEQCEIEGCMSVAPGEVYEKVKRAFKVKVRALDRDGNPLELEAEDYMAKCLQHEIDHLNGLIYLDRISRLKRDRLEKKIARAQKENSK